MVACVPMARRLVVGRWRAAVVVLACAAGFAGAQAANPPASAQSQESQAGEQPQSQPEGYSSSVHHKTKSNSAQVHHPTVAEEAAPPPELTHAEELIDKRDYA